MRFAFQMGNTLTEVDATAANNTMNIVAFFKQKLAQVGAILARNTRN